jgi:hypothetical protein
MTDAELLRRRLSAAVAEALRHEVPVDEIAAALDETMDRFLAGEYDVWPPQVQR